MAEQCVFVQNDRPAQFPNGKLIEREVLRCSLIIRPIMCLEGEKEGEVEEEGREEGQCWLGSPRVSETK